MVGEHQAEAVHGPSSAAPWVVGGASKPVRSTRGEAVTSKCPISPDLVASAPSGDPVVTLFPRRKQGQKHPGGGRGPVVLNLETLEHFYCYPLHLAAKKLGICQTAIKKVCRRLGIKKWPYKDMRPPTTAEEAAAGAERGSASPTDVSEQAESAILAATRRLGGSAPLPGAGGSGSPPKLATLAHGDEGIKDAVAALLTLNRFALPPQAVVDVTMGMSMATAAPGGAGGGAVKVEAAT